MRWIEFEPQHTPLVTEPMGLWTTVHVGDIPDLWVHVLGFGNIRAARKKGNQHRNYEAL